MTQNCIEVSDEATTKNYTKITKDYIYRIKGPKM